MIPLRVLHLIAPLGGGPAASWGINLLRWLRDHGHETRLVTSGGEREEGVRQEGFGVSTYSAGGLRWRLGGPKRLAEELRPWSADLVHVHGVSNASLGAALAQRLGVVALVGVEREATAVEADHLRHPAIGLVLVPNESLRAHLVGRRGLDRDRVALLPWGLDLQRFPAPPRQWQHPVLCMVCDLRRQRRAVRDVLAAVAAARRQDPEIRLVLVATGGDGAEEQLREACAQHDLTAAATVVSAPLQFAPHLARIDILVHPATSDWNPLVVVKAMACGCAVVASGIGSIPELVQDGRTGLLVPPGDGNALALALARLANDASLASTLAAAGRQVVASRHDITLVGEVCHDLYRRVMRGRTGGTSGTETVTAYRRITSAAGQRT